MAATVMAVPPYSLFLFFISLSVALTLLHLSLDNSRHRSSPNDSFSDNGFPYVSTLSISLLSVLFVLALPAVMASPTASSSISFSLFRLLFFFFALSTVSLLSSSLHYREVVSPSISPPMEASLMATNPGAYIGDSSNSLSSAPFLPFFPFTAPPSPAVMALPKNPFSIYLLSLSITLSVFFSFDENLTAVMDLLSIPSLSQFSVSLFHCYYIWQQLLPSPSPLSISSDDNGRGNNSSTSIDGDILLSLLSSLSESLSPSVLLDFGSYSGEKGVVGEGVVASDFGGYGRMRSNGGVQWLCGC